MQRIAVVARRTRCATRWCGGRSGSVELDEPADSSGAPVRQHGRCSGWARTPNRRPAALLCCCRPSCGHRRAGAGWRADLLAGEAQLQQYAAAAVCRRDVAAVPGCARPTNSPPGRSLDAAGAAAVPLPTRGGGSTNAAQHQAGAFRQLLSAGAHLRTVPYHDIDPTCGPAGLRGDVRNDVR